MASIGFSIRSVGVSEELQPAPGSPGQIPPPASDDWKVFLKRLARTCSRPEGSGEAVVLQTDSQQIAHVRGKRDQLPFTLRFVVASGRVEQIDATLGAATKDPAPLSISRRRGTRGRRVKKRGDGPRVSPGTESFGRQFVVHDSTGDAATLVADAEIRARMQQFLHGWLGIWPGEGVRYLAHPPEDGWPVPLAEVAFSSSDADTTDIEGLVELLLELAAMSEVR